MQFYFCLILACDPTVLGLCPTCVYGLVLVLTDESAILCPQTVSWFTKGAFNSTVRELMSRDVASFGKGGNGELVEAFHSGQRFVIKKVLLASLS